MDRVRKRIFMINQTDESERFGVGRYISQMVLETQKIKNGFEMVVVTIGAVGVRALRTKKIKNIHYLDFPKPFVAKARFIQGMSEQFSMAIFCILADLFFFSENDIFHFNNNMQHFLVKEIKENTNAKIIYTIHISLWKVFYKNDKKKFLSLWKEPDEKSINILNIRAEKKNCMLADSVVCLTNGMARDVWEFYKIPKCKINIVPNGIEASTKQYPTKEITSLAQGMEIQKDEFVLLYVGRLNEQKGVKELLKAFISASLSADETLNLVVVGEGYLRKTLIDIAKKNTAKIYFTGYVEPDEIYKYYEMADGMVFPTVNEQSSYVMLEAMKYKVPLIVTDIPAFEVLKNGHSCLKSKLVEGKINTEGLAKKIRLLTMDSALREHISKNALELFKEKFTSKNMFNRTYLDL